MIIGVPKEIKPDERRVALTPAGTAALTNQNHTVIVERGAGLGSGFDDRDYRAAGAKVGDSAAAVWKRASMILKVKEPQPSEFKYFRPELILFTYLHLAADPRLARELMQSRVSALGYETVQLDDGSLPLLAPMSEVAGPARHTSWWMVSRSTKWRRGHIIERRARGTSGEGGDCRRRDCGFQRLPGGGRNWSRSHNPRRESFAPALPERRPGESGDHCDVHASDAC
jgi:hypothetical protein